MREDDEAEALEVLRALVQQLQGSGYRDRHGNPIELNIPYRDAIALLKLRSPTTPS